MWYRFVGADRPASIEQWEVFGATTARTVAVSCPNHLPPSTRVWIAAAWYNPRGEQGRLSLAVYTEVMGGMAVNRTLLAGAA